MAFPIAETDNYVRKILGNAGKIPKGTPEQILQHLLPHVIRQESGGNPRAVSPKGAVGRLQTMPATLKDPGFGVKPAADDSDAERERVGRDYLLAMLKRYPGRVDLALAAYNAGPGRADKWGGYSLDPKLLRASAGLEQGTEVAPEWGPLPSAEDVAQRAGFFTNVVGRDSSIGMIHRAWEDMGVPFDPTFDLSQLTEDEWHDATDGIPEEYWDSLASAGSRAHLDLLSTRLRTSLKAEEELAAYGGWGIAGRIGLNMLDPLALAVGVATGGIGFVGTTGTRLAQAARVARTAGRLEEAGKAVQALEAVAKASAWRGAGRAAAAGGGTNALLELGLVQDDPLRGGWDVAAAALTGAFLGAGSARIFNGLELRRIQGAYMREAELFRVAELNQRLDTRRTELTAELAQLTKARDAADPDVTAARKALEDLSAELRAAAEGRRLELTQTAAGALKRSELGALRRQTEGLRKQARGADDLESQVEARMLREDIESLGEDIAQSKQRAKLRRSAAKAEAAGRKETIRSNLERAETALGRAQAADAARTELRRIERQAAKDEPLLMLDEPGRNRFGERELELTQTLSRALGVQQERVSVLDARRAAIKEEIKGLEKARAEGVRAIDDRTVKEAEAFGRDTASAARFLGFDEGTHPRLDGAADDSGLPSVGQMRLAGAVSTRPFATFSGVLRGHQNETVRKLLGRLVGNATGNKDGSANLVGASEIHARIHESMTAKFYSGVEPAYKDWAERHGIGMIERRTRPVRERFMAEVGLHIRGQASDDPAIGKAASKIQTIFADYLKQAKEAGVKGFEEVEANPSYLPRVFDFDHVHQIEHDIGTGNLELLIRSAILEANEGISEKAATRIAQAYLTRMKELRVGSDVHLQQGVGWDDVAFLKRFLEDTGVDSKEVTEIVEELRILNLQRMGKKDEGSFRYAKLRQQFDENFSMAFRSQDGARAGKEATVEIRMSDLFENNVEHLFGRYSRTVSGHIGLAKVGIKSRKDFNDSIKMVERELADDVEDLKHVKQYADAAYKLITGQPIQDANTLTRIGRAARDYNFATTMNQVGWAQFPDLAGLIGKGYIGFTFRQFFGGDAFRLFRRTDGSLDDPFAREMEEWLGVGTDFHNNATFSSFDPGEENGLKGALGKTEHGLRVMGRGTQVVSGMAWITAFSQRLVARSIVQRLVKDVTHGGAFTPQRAATLGLTPAMSKRIAAQLRAHTEFVNGEFGGKARVVNWMKWDDVDARDSMLNAVFREARRLVQEEDLGDTTLWMHKNWGKIIAQFRRFALVSYSKQILHGITHADAEEATRLALSMVMASMAYTARHHVALGAKIAGGASQEEVDEYREKYLTYDRLAAAAFANSTYSGPFPALFDSTVGMAVGERFFDTRSSGLGSDVITGNPTYRTFKNTTRAAQGIGTAITRGDKQFDEGDANALRKLLPYQNVIGVDALYEALTADLPEQDEDPDPDRVDWFLQD